MLMNPLLLAEIKNLCCIGGISNCDSWLFTQHACHHDHLLLCRQPYQLILHPSKTAFFTMLIGSVELTLMLITCSVKLLNFSFHFISL